MNPVKEFEWRCLLNGLRKPTKEQVRVVSRAFESDRVFQAEELFGALESESERISRATVFRTLQRLASLGMLSQDGFAFRLTDDS